MQVSEVIKKVAEICRQYGATEVLLFGSRAKGTARENSDIDIAVSNVKNYDALTEEIENLLTLYTVDIVDMNACQNKLLLEDIRQYGRKI